MSQLQERVRMLSKRLAQLNRKGDFPHEITTIGFDNELEVNFKVSEGNRGILLQQLFHTLEEEGAQVTSLNYSTVGDQVLGTIRAEVKKENIHDLALHYFSLLETLVYM